jgi:hypothetical protein
VTNPLPQGGVRKVLKGRTRAQSFARRLESSQALAGYTAEDQARVRATRAIILPQADAIAGAVYRHLLSHPETAVHFALADGRPDRAHLEERTGSLKAWLKTVIEAPLDDEFASYAAGIGRAHTRRGGTRPSHVRGRYLVLAMSFLQSQLAGVLAEAIEDGRELGATIAAWNKLLMIQLDLFLAVYGTAEGNPRWY